MRVKRIRSVQGRRSGTRSGAGSIRTFRVTDEGSAPDMTHSVLEIQVGIDTGGTFTDLVAFDPQTGQLSTFKTPSVPSKPGQALLDAINGAELPVEHIGALVHGTTVATNALI